MRVLLNKDARQLDQTCLESDDTRDRLPGSFIGTSLTDDEGDDVSSDGMWDNIQQIPAVSEPLEVRCYCHCSLPRLRVKMATTQAICHWIYSVNRFFPSPNDDFAERFKYDLISSKLLSSSVAPSPIDTSVRTTTDSPTRPLPGELQIPQQDVQRIEGDLRTISGGFVCFGLAALWKEHRATAILALLLSILFAKAPTVPRAKYAYIPQTLECLESLKAAGNAWDNAVNEAIAIIEKDERK